jgi:hypothetical protein
MLLDLPKARPAKRKQPLAVPSPGWERVRMRASRSLFSPRNPITAARQHSPTIFGRADLPGRPKYFPCDSWVRRSLALSEQSDVKEQTGRGGHATTEAVYQHLLGMQWARSKGVDCYKTIQPFQGRMALGICPRVGSPGVEPTAGLNDFNPFRIEGDFRAH